MSTVDPNQITSSVFYPESDGQPMGETDLHIYWTIRVREILQQRYRHQHTYVASNLLVYYEEGVPRKFVVPDVFVVLDCDPNFRRVYKIWEEPRPPQVVFEITSSSTRREDETMKPGRYELIGVEEYFLYDPTSDYLAPALQGFRAVPGGFERIEADVNGRLNSKLLGIELELDESDLVMRDSANDQVLLTGQEAAEDQAREAEEQAREAEAQARAAVDRVRVANDQAREAEQKAKAADELTREAEQKAKAANDQAREAEQKAKAAEQRVLELEAENRRLRERFNE